MQYEYIMMIMMRLERQSEVTIIDEWQQQHAFECACVPCFVQTLSTGPQTKITKLLRYKI